jgi:hypothetical protein
MEFTQIDETIFASVNRSWTKVALLIARVAALSKHSLPEDEGIAHTLIEQRIAALIAEHRLELRGDLRNWRSSEVRLYNDTT